MKIIITVKIYIYNYELKENSIKNYLNQNHKKNNQNSNPLQMYHLI